MSILVKNVVFLILSHSPRPPPITGAEFFVFSFSFFFLKNPWAEDFFLKCILEISGIVFFTTACNEAFSGIVNVLKRPISHYK